MEDSEDFKNFIKYLDENKIDYDFLKDNRGNGVAIDISKLPSKEELLRLFPTMWNKV